MSQNLEVEDEKFQRRFEYTQCRWKIKNYFAAICEREWPIETRAFSVGSTKWRLFLKPKYTEEKCFIQAYLQRLEIDHCPNPVYAEWTLEYFTGSKRFGGADKKEVFHKKTAVRSCFFDTEPIERMMLTTKRYSLLFKCRIIVYEKDDKLYGGPKDSGLKYLSQSMKTLYKTNKRADIKLPLGGDRIRAHKAILWARNNLLRTKIQRREKIDIYHFVKKPKGAATNFFGYLYTADLNYVLRIPTISMVDFIDGFDIRELKKYFVYDELVFRNSYPARTSNFDWLITDSRHRKEACLMGPIWYLAIIDLTFRLCLYPRGCGQETGYMSLIVEFMDGGIANGVYVVCSTRDPKTQNYEWKWKLLEGRNTVAFEKFVSNDTEQHSPLFNDNTMIICCSIIVPTGIDKSQCNMQNKRSFQEYPRTDEHYERLSFNLLSLLESGGLSDLTLISNDSHFKVHKAILSCRSHVLDSRITELEEGTHLNITDVEPNTLRTVVHYIYSGKLENHDLKDIEEIYDAANKLGILPLKNKCSPILKDNIAAENVLKVLVLACDGKDFKLKNAVLKFFCSNLLEIYSSEKWNKFKQDFPRKYVELVCYLRKKLPSFDFKSDDLSVDCCKKNFIELW